MEFPDSRMTVSGVARLIVWLCILINIAGLFAFAQQRSYYANPKSRYATIDSLVHRGTFIIDESRYVKTSDRVKLNGHFLSPKPPVLPTLSAGCYWVFTRVTNKTFASDEKAVLLFLDIIVGFLPHILLLFFFYRFLLVWIERESALVLSFVAVAFNYIGLGYATGMNNHTPAAAALFISFFHAYLLHSGRSDSRHRWFLSGLLAGLAATLELWAAVYCVAITLYLAGRDWRRTVSIFIPSSLPFLALHFFLSYISTGSLEPIYLRPELYFYPGSYWFDKIGIDAAREPKPIYFFHMILGHHGLLAMTPVLFLACWSLCCSLSKGAARRAEAALIGISSLITALLLGFRTNNYGGLCAGFRWLIIIMPPLFLFVAAWLEKKRSWLAISFFIFLLLIGFLNVLDCLMSPWAFSRWHQLFIRLGMGSCI